MYELTQEKRKESIDKILNKGWKRFFGELRMSRKSNN